MLLEAAALLLTEPLAQRVDAETELSTVTAPDPK